MAKRKSRRVRRIKDDDLERLLNLIREANPDEDTDNAPDDTESSEG
jgi:hypothetical protein